MRTAVVLFTRDLRVHDNPALHAAAAAAETLVPLFVRDPSVPAPPNRQQFLDQSLDDLRRSLRERGGELFVRRGDPVTEAVKLARKADAQSIFVAEDVSGFAAARRRRLEDACTKERLTVDVRDSVTIVPPGLLHPGGSDHYKIFTPYWRAWSTTRHRAELPAPQRVRTPAGIAVGRLSGGGRATGLLPGGESEARRRLSTWRATGSSYAQIHDDLAADATSRMSPYLHFGCVSPVTVAAAIDSEEYLRQLCWRDFFHQVLHAFPDLPRRNYQAKVADDWRYDAGALAAWQQGCTGIPIIDAGMRQLAGEGWMHNRARLITATFLTRQLGLDWREGAQWYAQLLLDADVANNIGNWQWVAGTGNDPRINRRFNAIRQAQRYDHGGDYVRRWVPELAHVPGGAVHQPWRLPPNERRALRYGGPLAPTPEIP
jgi:deoxyribodipyrimidine photo-lyase